MRRCISLLVFSWLAVSIVGGLRAQQGCNPIVCENQLPGSPSSEWDVSGSGDSSIQGFATDISVNIGDTVHFKVNTSAASFNIAIYRLGYYAGNGARRIATLGPFTGTGQPACLTVSSTGLIDCGNWSESASWAVPATAVSGVYLARLSRADNGGASHMVFIVRDDTRQADILFQTADETWQAYNTYGGKSLYVGGPGTNPSRAYKVSYNRPFTTRGSGPEDWLFNAEYPMIRFLEANGYNVSYFTGVDSDRYGAELFRHRAFIAVGHDEYWSGPQRANVEAARNAGVNLAFFSGNEVFWKTRWESSIDGSGTPYRTLVSYKETHANAKIDPQDPPTWTGTWRDKRFSPPADGGRPENALTGTIFTVNCCTSDAAIRVPQTYSSQPFWRNTRVATLPVGGSTTLTTGTLGYEWDENLDNGSRPSGLTALSSTTVSVSQKLQDNGSTYAAGTATHQLTLYRHVSGALVFGAGTVQWSWGLDSNHDRASPAPDLAMQQATVNLFADMGVSPGSLQPGLVGGASDTTAPTVSLTAPAAATTVSGAVSVTASASDNVGVAGVQFRIDGAPLGAEVTSAPYSVFWDSTSNTNGPHSLTAVARDAAGNQTTSAAVSVTSSNAVISGLSVDATAFGDRSTVGTSIATSAFSTTSANELLLAFVAADDTSTGQQVTGVSGATLTWQLVVRTNAQRGTSEIWRAFATSVLTNVTVTATLAQSAAASITVLTVKGADPSTPIGAMGSASAASGAPTASLVTTRPGSLVVGVGNDWDAANSHTVGASQMLVHQYLATVGDAFWSQRTAATVAAAGTTVTINDTAPTTDKYNLSLCEILSAQTTSVPAVANVTAGPFSATSVGINWTTTVPANSQVRYGTTASYGSTTTLDPAMTLSHTQTLTGLTSGALYHFQVVSNDGSTTLVSQDSTFTAQGGLIFADEFTGTSVDTTSWAVMNRPGDQSNNEVEYYLPANAALAGGQLVLTSKSDASVPGYSYTSAMVQWKTFNFIYGTLEVRAKMAGGRGTWPALWMLGSDCQQSNIVSADNVAPCSWPVPGSDEIDLTEIMNAQLTTVGQYVLTGSFNGGCTPSATDVSQNWHTYSLVWNPGSVVWKIDGVTTCTITSNVPTTGKFLLINTAMGGNSGPIDPSTFPQTLSVDYVRVYSQDPTPPTVSVTAPASGAGVSGSAVTISASTSDNVAVAGVQFTVDGNNIGAEDTTSPYSVSWNSTTVSNGPHTLGAVARDGAGNKTTATVNVTVNNPPIISGVTINQLSATSATISWTTNVAASSQVNFGLTSSYTSSTAFDSTLTTSHSQVLNGLTSATTYHYQLVSMDGTGSTAMTQDAMFTTANPTDTTNPVTSLSAPAANATVSGTTVTVSANASDNVGVVGVQFKLDGNNLGAEDTTAPYSVTWNTTTAANGTHNLTAVARDAAGNSATSAAVTVTVSNAQQPLAIDAASWGDQPSTSAKTVTASVTTAGANELLLAFVAADDVSAGNTVSGVSGGGLTWQLVARANGRRGVSEVWRAWAASKLTATSVTATLVQGAASSMSIVSFVNADSTGANGSGAIGATRIVSSTGAPSGAVVTTRANSWVLGVGNDWDNATARTLGPNQTMVHQNLPAVGDTYWVQRMTAATPAAGTNVTINDTAPTGDQYNLVVVEVLGK